MMYMAVCAKQLKFIEVLEYKNESVSEIQNENNQSAIVARVQIRVLLLP